MGSHLHTQVQGYNRRRRRVAGHKMPGERPDNAEQPGHDTQISGPGVGRAASAGHDMGERTQAGETKPSPKNNSDDDRTNKSTTTYMIINATIVAIVKIKIIASKVKPRKCSRVATR